MNTVREKKTGLVPPYLRDAHYEGSKELGHVGYLYPHDFPGHFVKQQYLPDDIANEKFYEPSQEGYEAKVKERLDDLYTDEE